MKFERKNVNCGHGSDRGCTGTETQFLHFDRTGRNILMSLWTEECFDGEDGFRWEENIPTHELRSQILRSLDGDGTWKIPSSSVTLDDKELVELLAHLS